MFSGCDAKLRQAPALLSRSGKGIVTLYRSGQGIGFLNKPDGFFGNEAYNYSPPDARK